MSQWAVKQVQTRGMNDIENWKERRDATEDLIELLENDLKNGYNPITNRTLNAKGEVKLTNNSLVIDGLEKSLERLKKRTTDDTWKGIRVVVNFIKDNVNTSDIKIGGIHRAEVIEILDRVELAKIEKTKRIDKDGTLIKAGEFTANSFNHFRKYLGIVFGELVSMGAIHGNPVDKYLLKRKHLVSERETLTAFERERVKEHLSIKHPEFHRFVHIFFHSGSRLEELMKVQGKHVFLEKQAFKIKLLKGKQWSWATKAIKADAFPYWQELMCTCGPEDYVFGKGLVPGSKAIDRVQVTRRWKVHIKDKLGITKDLYSLKHLHTDELAEKLEETISMELAEQEAQKHNSHTSLKMTERYAPGIKRRREQKRATTLKEIRHEF